MHKIILTVLLFFSVCMLHAGGALRIADASRAGIGALNAAALKLAAAENTAVSVDRVTPREALQRLRAGRADLIVLEHGNLPPEFAGKSRLFAAEVLAVYIHAGNRINNISRRELREIMTDKRPGWSSFSPLMKTDIHRFGLNERAPGYRLAESLLGVDKTADEIFKTSTAAETVLLVQNDPDALGVAPLIPTGSGVKVLNIQNISPTLQNIKAGKYLLCWRYYIIVPQKISSAALEFLKITDTRDFLRDLEDSGFMAL